MNKVLLSIGYDSYILPDGIELQNVLDVFNGMIEVQREYYEGKDIYEPKESEVKIEIKFIPETDIRCLTKEEKENKEIKSLKSSVEYRDNQIKEKDEKLKALQCELDLLKQQSEST